jgi:hypothetical protein
MPILSKSALLEGPDTIVFPEVSNQQQISFQGNVMANRIRGERLQYLGSDSLLSLAFPFAGCQPLCDRFDSVPVWRLPMHV